MVSDVYMLDLLASSRGLCLVPLCTKPSSTSTKKIPEDPVPRGHVLTSNIFSTRFTFLAKGFYWFPNL